MVPSPSTPRLDGSSRSCSKPHPDVDPHSEGRELFIGTKSGEFPQAILGARVAWDHQQLKPQSMTSSCSRSDLMARDTKSAFLGRNITRHSMIILCSATSDSPISQEDGNHRSYSRSMMQSSETNWTRE